MINRGLMMLWTFVAIAVLSLPQVAHGDSHVAPTPQPTASVAESKGAPTAQIEPIEPGAGFDDPKIDSNAVSALMIALASALGGALLTLVGDRFLSSHQEKIALEALLLSVSKEISLNKTLAVEREGLLCTEPFEFYEPLTENAWTTLRGSGLFWRLTKKEEIFVSLSDLYAKIESANHSNELAWRMFDLTQSLASPDPRIAKIYLEKAMLLITDPYTPVVEAVNKALKHLPNPGDIK